MKLSGGVSSVLFNQQISVYAKLGRILDTEMDLGYSNSASH